MCPPPHCQAGPLCVRLPADKLLLDVVASPSCLTCLCLRWILACPSPHCPAGPLFVDAPLVPCVFTSPPPGGSLICTFMFPLFPHVSISPLVSCASASPLSGWYRIRFFLVKPSSVRFPAGPSYEPSRWQSITYVSVSRLSLMCSFPYLSLLCLFPCCQLGASCVCLPGGLVCVRFPAGPLCVWVAAARLLPYVSVSHLGAYLSVCPLVPS